jgi:hypothetical protein
MARLYLERCEIDTFQELEEETEDIYVGCRSEGGTGYLNYKDRMSKTPAEFLLYTGPEGF